MHLHERLRIALDRNAELEMKVHAQSEALRRAEVLLRSSAKVATSGPFAGMPFPPPAPSENNLRTPAPQSPQRQHPPQQTSVRRTVEGVAATPLEQATPAHEAAVSVEPEVEQIIKGIASIEATNMANLSTISKQLSTTQNINQELMVQVAQLHTRQEKAEADARLAESQRQAQIEEQQKREREALGRQQETSTNAIVGELRRLREAVSDKDEIENVLVGGFSSLVAAASPALAPRTRGDEEPNYFTAPAPGSPSVYATPAPVNFSREDAKRSGIASGLRRWHDAAADEVISAPAFNTVDQSSEKAPASSGEGDIQREMAWNKFAASLRNSRK